MVGVGGDKWISGLRNPGITPKCFDLNTRKSYCGSRKRGEAKVERGKIKIDFKHSI